MNDQDKTKEQLINELHELRNKNDSIKALWDADSIRGKQAEGELKDSKQLLLASLECQKDTILFSINQKYQYLYFNKAHFDGMKFVYNSSVKNGANILDCITSDDDRIIAKDNYDRALNGESHSNVRAYGKGNLAYYESFFNPILNDKNEIIGATGLARNITARKKTEQIIKKNQTKLKELSATKNKLFSIIAHDLRSPFNAILGFSELLLNIAKSQDLKETKKYSSIINSTAENTLFLLDNLLNWEKTQTGRINFNPEKVNLSSLIKKLVESSHPNTIIKNISLNYIPSNEIAVYADLNMIETVFRNLISNAIKFTSLNGKINIYTKCKQDFCEITISDNGIGMDKEKCKRLFNLDTNISTLGTANEKGTGLGLLLCEEFVKKNKGDISVKSELGKGSDFKFTLPLIKS